MTSSSADVSRTRPFYSAHADLYDLLVDDPVEPWVDEVDHRLRARAADGASILDAGCGTGRHAAALVERGYRLTLGDASPQLLQLAKRRCPNSPGWLIDLCRFETSARFDAVTCRGVLNDLLTERERQGALECMFRCLGSRGLLIAGVRDATAAPGRADGTERSKTVRLPGQVEDRTGSITFTYRSRWVDGLIEVREEHRLCTSGTTTTSVFEFAMRPWTEDELEDRCAAAGFRRVRVYPGVGHTSAGRLLVVASR